MKQIDEQKKKCDTVTSFYEHAFPRVDISISTNFILED